MFDEYLMFKRKQNWMIFKNGPHMRFASSLKVSKVGMRAFHKVSSFVKPTTRMIQRFGQEATKARLRINEEQLVKLLVGDSIPVDLDLDDGYVILDLGKRLILGLGLIINGEVRSQLPRKELREGMMNRISLPRAWDRAGHSSRPVLEEDIQETFRADVPPGSVFPDRSLC